MTQIEKFKITLVMLYSFTPLGLLAWATPEKMDSCAMRELLARHQFIFPVRNDQRSQQAVGFNKVSPLVNVQNSRGPASVSEGGSAEFHCLKRLRQ